MPKIESQRVVPKTASYTVSPAVDKNGTIFSNEGASGAVTFTLPTPNRALLGQHYEFLGLVDQNLIVSAGAGNGVAVHNASCASIAAQTASQKIGAVIVAKCIRTSSTGNGTFKWHLSVRASGITATVA